MIIDNIKKEPLIYSIKRFFSSRDFHEGINKNNSVFSFKEISLDEKNNFPRSTLQ